jgi:hypothetical protein
MLTIDEASALGERLEATAANIDAATHAYFTDLRAFELAEAWHTLGATSGASWISVHCHVAPGTAREHVRVALALGGLPLIDDALRKAQLSYAKVREITRVATKENEERLLELGRMMTAAQLAKMCRILDQVEPRDPVRDEERRYVRSRSVANGMVRVEAQLRPEEAARVIAACDVFAASAAERADALVTLADATLRGDQPDRPPAEVLVHIDAATLTGNTAGAGIPSEACRRLLCDSGVVPILEDAEGKPLELGRKTRIFCGALRRALFARDGHCCRFPGCTNTRYLDGHHLVHWIDGGETKLSNGLTICRAHHALLHEGGYRVVGDGASLRFLRPDGRVVDASQTRPTPRPLPAVEEKPPKWDGEPVDYDAVVAYAMG